MTTPRRRPLELDDTWDRDLRNLERSVRRDAPQILLGVSALKAELHDAGWPARSPADDRGPRLRPEADKDVARVWQCCTCRNQFDDWALFEAHALASGHPEAEQVTTGHSMSGPTHTDPAGNAAMDLWNHHGDLGSLQDHLHAIATSWRAIKLISARHKPDGDKRTEPACWYATCENVVAKRVLPNGAIAYRGMTCIDGVWVASPGARPTCERHRKTDREDAA
jgi:hypothetical protein